MKRDRSVFRKLRRYRSGITLLEVVVVTILVLLLATIVLRSMMTSRTTIHRIQCRNNLRVLTAATLNYAERHRNRLPYLVYGTQEQPTSNWITALLPELDQKGLARQLSEVPSGDWAKWDAPSLKILQCDENQDVFQKPGALSYVANSGYGYFSVDKTSWAVSETGIHSPSEIDWNGDGEVTSVEKVAGRSTGVFWREGTVDQQPQMGFVLGSDGQSNTILFAESLYAGKWTSFETMDIAFVAGLDRIKFKGEREQANILTLDSADLGPFAPQGGRVPRRSPGPSGNHRGGLYFGMADGNVKFIDSEIDQLVSLKLMTSNGQQFGQTVEGLENY